MKDCKLNSTKLTFSSIDDEVLASIINSLDSEQVKRIMMSAKRHKLDYLLSLHSFYPEDCKEQVKKMFEDFKPEKRMR